MEKSQVIVGGDEGGGYPLHMLQAKKHAGDTCQVSALTSSYQPCTGDMKGLRRLARKTPGTRNVND